MDQPLRWTRPRKIFVCAHGDLFHENVPDEWIDRVFAVMALAPRHTFQVLTKRSERMLAYMNERWQPSRAMRLKVGADVLDIPAATSGETRRDQVSLACEEFIDKFNMADQDNKDHWTPEGSLKATMFSWPLPNVWLGVSVEDRARIPRLNHLRATPAAFRFVSFEPLLEDLGTIDLTGIDMPIVGGESGPGHRFMDPAWARSIRDQCATIGARFFMKQMSGKTTIPDDLMIREMPR